VNFNVKAQIVGTTAFDLMYGTSGADYINGHFSPDHIYGLDGDDYLVGSKGSDLIYGGDGNDVLAPGPHTAQLYGEAGDDVLMHSNDVAVLDGGAGTNDTVQFQNSQNLIIDYATKTIDGIERIDLTGNLIGAGNTLANLTVADVLTSDNNTLFVEGDNDAVTTSATWTAGGTVTVNGTAYDKYTAYSGDDLATLYIDTDLTKTGF